MTGLLPDSDRIIEVALVVTNSNLDIVAEAPVWVVHQSDEVLETWTTQPCCSWPIAYAIWPSR